MKNMTSKSQRYEVRTAIGATGLVSRHRTLSGAGRSLSRLGWYERQRAWVGDTADHCEVTDAAARAGEP